jgi:hypothetical protein
VCGRRMDAAWVHGNAAYRCRHGYTTGTPRPAGHLNTYSREDHMLEALPHLIGPHAMFGGDLIGDPVGDVVVEPATDPPDLSGASTSARSNDTAMILWSSWPRADG